MNARLFHSRPYALAAALLLCLGMGCSRSSPDAAAKASPQASAPAPKTSGGEARDIAGGRSGVGWSISAKTDVAVNEALSHADAQGKADLIMTFYTAEHLAQDVQAAIRAHEGASQRIIGASSFDGILTSDGYHVSPNGVLGVLALRVPGMKLGVGGASFDEAAGGESARLAFKRALADAGNPKKPPTMVLLFANRGTEEAMLAALTQEIGPDVPLMGGTAAGRAADIAQKRDALAWSTIANGQHMSTGAAVAVFYTQDQFAYSYGGGFNRVTTKQGVITDSEPRIIKTIDNRPAFDVYDDWVGGAGREAKARGEQFTAAWLVKNISNNGVYHDQFVHVFTRDNGPPGALYTDANVSKGDVVYPTEGSWNILMNRFAVMPREARRAAHDMTAALGLFIYCAGSLKTIPVDQRNNMSYLVSQSIGDMPWLGIFSWGEQGHVPGVGNFHGNLMASTLLFPAEGATRL